MEMNTKRNNVATVEVEARDGSSDGGDMRWCLDGG